MSERDDTKPEQPTVDFRHLCKVSDDTLLALSVEGAVYQREFSDDAEGITTWRRLCTVSSTQLEVRRCSYPGCDSLCPGGLSVIVELDRVD
jgi:hypothetical protein